MRIRYYVVLYVAVVMVFCTWLFAREPKAEAVVFEDCFMEAVEETAETQVRETVVVDEIETVVAPLEDDIRIYEASESSEAESIIEVVETEPIIEDAVPMMVESPSTCIVIAETTVAEETESDTLVEMVQETVAESTVVDDGFMLRSVNGAVLDENLQRYLWGQLNARGIGHYYDLALCQIYQESRFNASAEALNGLDKGLCQFRILFWDSFSFESGLTNGNIFNPIDSIYVYAYLMAKYIGAYGDIDMAISAYYTGGSYYDQTYVDQVKQWIGTLQ